MQALQFWKTVTADKSNLLERLIALLNENHIRYCVVGGQAVNAYAEPVVTLDLDLAVAVDQLPHVESLLGESFRLERFEHRLNVSLAGSDLRIQVQTDPRYAAFVKRAVERDVLGLRLPVAAIEDVMRGKIWAAQDSSRRASKRQKDLADISRLLEYAPNLRSKVPEEILRRLV